jgi:peptidoglycan/LPS O-acetylase OafA/YrhL
VDGFFVLSGFLIMQSWDRDPDLHDFALKRLLRLVPALLAALVFGALVIGPLATTAPLAEYLGASSTWAHFGSVALHRHLASPLLFADNPVPYQLNASLWSLRYELLCYGVVALVGSVCGGSWRLLAPLLLCAGLAGQAAVGWLGVPATSAAVALARLIACFFAGSTAYTLRDRLPYTPVSFRKAKTGPTSERPVLRGRSARRSPCCDAGDGVRPPVSLASGPQ